MKKWHSYIFLLLFIVGLGFVIYLFLDTPVLKMRGNSNITLETLEKMDNPMSTAKLSITPEKREVLSQLGVNIPDDAIENQNQWGML